jgi:hypothetical protein
MTRVNIETAGVKKGGLKTEYNPEFIKTVLFQARK